MSGFGDFMADKTRQHNPSGLPSAIGIAWYRRDTYEQCRAIFEDATNLPDTFDDWRFKAKQAEDGLRARGMRVVRVEIDPDTFPAWCAANGHNVDAEARMHYGNLKVAELLMPKRE